MQKETRLTEKKVNIEEKLELELEIGEKKLRKVSSNVGSNLFSVEQLMYYFW